MAWVISVLGAVLAAGGGVALWSGSGYIRLDWGQAETVSGTVALSAGIVTIAIAAVLFTLRDLARRPARAAGSGVGFEALHLADEAEPPARGRVAGRLATMGLPKADRRDEVVGPSADLEDRRGPPDAGRDGTEVEPVAAPRMERTSPAPAAPAPRADERSAPPRRAPIAAEPASAEAVPAEPEPDFDPRPRAVPEAPRPAAPMLAEAPTVVGRYEANGASYVLFSDGTIEVETESGTHRFASMAALKDHIERQDAV